MKIFIFALCLSVAVAEKIVGGEEATPNEAPYIINMKSNGAFRCGGSIVGASWVVTAAHCKSASSLGLTITAGDHLINVDEPSDQTVRVDLQIRHEDYSSSTLENDIMLLKLKEPLELNNEVASARLPSLNVDPADGLMCTVLGWGTLREGGRVSDKLMKVDVPVVNHNVCDSAYRKGGYQIYPGMLCLSFYPDGGKDACQGDSGGPAVCNGELHGITSWGIGCARADYPGVYTRVSHYVDWMSQTMVINA